eukprot:COSAG01_NODE_1473_length_10193_cov_13.155736_4_plen_182_part_00
MIAGLMRPLGEMHSWTPGLAAAAALSGCCGVALRGAVALGLVAAGGVRGQQEGLQLVREGAHDDGRCGRLSRQDQDRGAGTHICAMSCAMWGDAACSDWKFLWGAPVLIAKFRIELRSPHSAAAVWQLAVVKLKNGGPELVEQMVQFGLSRLPALVFYRHGAAREWEVRRPLRPASGGRFG